MHFSFSVSLPCGKKISYAVEFIIYLPVCVKAQSADRIALVYPHLNIVVVVGDRDKDAVVVD